MPLPDPAPARCVSPRSAAPRAPPPPTRSRVAHCTTRYTAGPTATRARPRPQTRHPRVTPTATLDSRVRVSHSPPAGPAPLTAQKHNSEPRMPVSPPRFRPREPFAPTAALDPRVCVSHSPPAGSAPLTAQRHNSEPRRPVSTPRFRPRAPSLQPPLSSRACASPHATSHGGRHIEKPRSRAHRLVSARAVCVSRTRYVAARGGWGWLSPRCSPSRDCAVP